MSSGPIGTGPAAELANLLRTRRAELQPVDVGLPAGRRRRTPGLRREEVALLAAVSPTYYSLLERGRASHPSPQVLDALASALRFSDAERDYVHALNAGNERPARSPSQPEVLAPGLAQLVDRQDPFPAYVTGRRWDVLASNRAARLLWTDWTTIAPENRNMLWWMFTSPQARAVFPDWEHEASAQLGRFRAAAARHVGEREFTELIDRLLSASPQAWEWWLDHDVEALGGGAKCLRHKELGQIRLDHVVLQVAGALEQKLVIFTPGADDVRRIADLIERG
ncbi:helix-turn-helix domain-containing protein [Gordonia sp. TBRC 11910]|uniref:Helix-turn-helix domain-containing protein n=1 Tax=Gordonia asplenii TaxID=2725283 RepID=A0A848KW77_9ACTN|nr:helix-turn-helix transcriptional regulator [Gordonia asplenii]NMO00713.1 helix-turn-helix domain-containing protein [Gordonia asplenii]